KHATCYLPCLPPFPTRRSSDLGMIFLPPNQAGREAIDRLFQETVRGEGQQLLGWRDVPTDNGALGPTAKASQPVIRQIFIGRGEDRKSTRLNSSHQIISYAVFC